MSHIPHPFTGTPFFYDECRECNAKVKAGGVEMDEQRFREFWQMMIEVEQGTGRYASVLDAQLGRSLYQVAVMLSRASGCSIPEILPRLSHRLYFR